MEDDIFRDPFLEYDKRLDKGEVVEICIDSKEQEIELSQLNDQDYSDEPSSDQESSFVAPRESELTFTDSQKDSEDETIDEKLAQNIQTGDGSDLSYLGDNQKTQRLQTEMVSKDMQTMLEGGKSDWIKV